MIVVQVALFIAVLSGLSILVMSLWPKVAKMVKRTPIVEDQPKVVFKSMAVETYGHDVDILKRVKETLPERTARLEQTRWDISVNVAGKETFNEELQQIEVGKNDSILSIRFIDVGNSSVPIDDINWNITRFLNENDQKFIMFKEAFTSDKIAERNAAKACQNLLMQELKEWANKCQDKYEYDHCPPEPVVEIV